MSELWTRSTRCLMSIESSDTAQRQTISYLTRVCTRAVEKMAEAAFSFPRSQIKEVDALVLSVARARNGWRLIREATAVRWTRRRSKPEPIS
jgi:hypothetical protein